MKVIKPYEMTYGELSQLCHLIEDYLRHESLGTNLHDIGSPLACITRNFCTERANEYYKETIKEINTTRASIAKEVLKEIQDSIRYAIQSVNIPQEDK